jgi:hypothetical protein
LRGSKGVESTIESYGKVEIQYSHFENGRHFENFENAELLL